MEKERRHSLAIFGAVVACVAFWVLVALAVLALAGCTVQKELHEEQVRSIVSDMLQKQQQEESHFSQHTENVDSMVSASVSQAMQEFAAQQTEKETTTETITTWVDSLGREMRQEQRTTQRELSRQEQQRQQQMMQQWQTQTERRMASMDSAWSKKLQEVESHLRDSLAAQKQLIKQTEATKGLTWWQKTWSWLKGVIIGLGIAVILMLTRRFWRGWIPIGK